MTKNKDTELHPVDMYQELPEGVIKKYSKRKRIVIVGVIILLLLVGSWFFLTHHTYSSYMKGDRVEFDNSSNNWFAKFGKNILKYSRDGAVLLDEKGSPIWNQTYEMANPIVAVNGESAIIADQGGNAIEVFGESGERGMIHTALPIEKVAVSKQGITAVILSDDASAMFCCYDTAGNILVENKITVSKSGYPIALALSEDGTMLFVSYLIMESKGISTRLVFYDFSTDASSQKEKATTEKIVEDTVYPEVFYMKEDVSAAVGEHGFLLYEKGTEPKITQEIQLNKEIRSVVHSDEYIAFVLENPEGDFPYELRVYNRNGKIVGSADFKGDYSRMILDDQTIILDAGASCKIFSVKGICVYDGVLEGDSSGILPVSGVFKYAVMKEDGIQIIRLIK